MTIATLAAIALLAQGSPPAARVAAPVATPPLTRTTVPGHWEGNGLPEGTDGVAWYVGEITLDDLDRATDMVFTPGNIDDADESWFNGTRIGSTDGWQTERAYTVPKSLLRTGVNRIAIRVTDSGGAGGWVGTPTLKPTLAGDACAFDLSGTWWICQGDQPELATFDPVMDPDLHARMVPIPVGTRRMKLTPIATVTGTLPDLWYTEPAAAWTDALPVGNGRMGAMVFGAVQHERLQLNEATVWEGNANDRHAPAASEFFQRARALALAGKVLEAQQIIQDHCMLPGDMMPRSHQTLGDLHIEMIDAPRAASEYRRSLTMRTGVAASRFQVDGVSIVREVIASAPDELLLIDTRVEGEGNLPAMRIQLHRDNFETDVPVHTAIPTRQGARLSFTGHTGQGGVGYASTADIQSDGGTITIEGGDAVVRGAKSLTIAIAARTDYFGSNPALQCENDLRSAVSGWSALSERASAWFAKSMDRVSLDLGGPSHEANVIPDLLSTPARLARFRTKPEWDNDFISLYFQYGRYLLLSSSRQGSLPANLQGIWNQHFRAPWNADFHTNINVQMNYWPAGPCALVETELPLIDLLDKIRVRGVRTAQDLYGARGWCCHHITDAWAMTAPEGQTVWGMYPLGGAWLVRHAWEHYEYTNDTAFLRDRAWPALDGAVRFLLDYLVKDPTTGMLVSGPSTSPENTFILPDGSHANLSMGTSMDQWIARDLLVNYLDAARILGKGNEALPIEAAAALTHLAMPTIASDGRLMEWSKPYGEAEPGHRHMSHLYGLHPANFISTDATPALAAAARASLEFRLKNGGGHTGWSRAWLINFWARLHDGERAWADICALLSHSTLPNLFDDHPPFQIDGNFGGTAGIAEMLMQSHIRSWSAGHLVHRIDLLPALPREWSDGRVRGLIARGNVVVDIQWKHGAIARVQLDSPDARELRIKMPAGVTRAHVAVAGQAPIDLPIPDGIVIIPRAAAPTPRSVVILP